MRAFIEPARAMTVWLGRQIDIADHVKGSPQANEAEEWLALFTPVAKAVFSDLGFQSGNAGMQIFGGHGYIRATGMEQLVRDVRIAQIQEGANGLLATALLRREVAAHGGLAFQRFLDEIDRTIHANSNTVELAPFAEALGAARTELEEVTRWVSQRAATVPDEFGAAGVEYQSLFGLTALAWFWLRIARAAAERDDDFGRDRLHIARFFFERVLPRRAGHVAILRGGSAPIMTPSPAFFERAMMGEAA